MIRRLAVPPFEALDPWLPRRGGSDAATRDAVAAILEDVLLRGDEAVREYTRRFDGVDLAPGQWELDPAGWPGALDRVAPALRSALERAVDRVREYHAHQKEEGFRLADGDGSLVGMKVTPIDRVGLYVPGGKASYPSSVVMNAVPALVAGVQEIVAVVPPQGVTDAVLAACALSGVTRIFQVGGAQAIAALAFGTATIPRVDKIVGPGNRWVAEAKRQVVGQVGIDMIAGPTEVSSLAESARPSRRDVPEGGRRGGNPARLARGPRRDGGGARDPRPTVGRLTAGEPTPASKKCAQRRGHDVVRDERWLRP